MRDLPVLILSCDPAKRRCLEKSFAEWECKAVSCPTVQQARTLLRQKPFFLAVCEEKVPDGSFRDVIAEIRRRHCHTPVVVASESNDWNHYLKLMRAGAFDSVSWPPARGELRRIASLAYGEFQQAEDLARR